jgi:hypothetical protein
MASRETKRGEWKRLPVLEAQHRHLTAAPEDESCRRGVSYDATLCDPSSTAMGNTRDMEGSKGGGGQRIQTTPPGIDAGAGTACGQFAPAQIRSRVGHRVVVCVCVLGLCVCVLVTAY